MVRRYKKNQINKIINATKLNLLINNTPINLTKIF